MLGQSQYTGTRGKGGKTTTYHGVHGQCDKYWTCQSSIFFALNMDFVCPSSQQVYTKNGHKIRFHRKMWNVLQDNWGYFGQKSIQGKNVALDINWNKVLIFSIMSHFWYHGPEFYGTNYGNFRWVSEGDVFERWSVSNTIWRHYEKSLCKWPMLFNTCA